MNCVKTNSRPSHEVEYAAAASRVLWNAFFWTYERTTWQYDLMVIAILAFVWLTPPDWLGDPDGLWGRTHWVDPHNAEC